MSKKILIIIPMFIINIGILSKTNLKKPISNKNNTNYYNTENCTCHKKIYNPYNNNWRTK